MGGDGDIDDPEAARVDELLDRAVRGGVSPAETEELALYAAQDPALQARIDEAGRQHELGRGWLERVHKHDEIAKVETSRRAWIERGAGLGLIGLGYLLQFFLPVLAALSLAGGVGLLLYSFIRVRLQTYKDDPYKDVER